MLLAEFGTGQVFWSMLWFFLFFIWIMLLFMVFADIFRSPDLSGWGKAIWSIFIIIIPYFGVFVYLIARGHKMRDHSIAQAQAQDAAAREYIQSTVSAPSTSEELQKLAALRDAGTITDDEFATAKAKLLG